MADRDRRGGYQPPAKPTAVSNPGSGNRTDGGPGNKSQPIRVASGGKYGQRKALTNQQQAAPLPDNTGGGRSNRIGPPAGPVPAVPSAFAPTQHPNQPNDAMPNIQAQNPVAANPQQALQVLYAKFPHPAIARLIDWSAAPPQ